MGPVKVRALLAQLPTDLQGFDAGTIIAPTPSPSIEANGQGIVAGFWIEGNRQVFMVLRYINGEPEPLGVWSTLTGAVQQQAGGEAMRDLWHLLTVPQRETVHTFFVEARDGEDVTAKVDAFTDACGVPRLSTLIKQRADAITIEVQAETLAHHLSHGGTKRVH